MPLLRVILSASTFLSFRLFLLFRGTPFSVIAKSVPFSVIPRIVFSCHSERSEESPPLCLYNSTKCIQKDTFNQNKNPYNSTLNFWQKNCIIKLMLFFNSFFCHPTVLTVIPRHTVPRNLLLTPLTGKEKCGKLSKNLLKKEVRGKHGANSRETLRDDVPQSDRK